MSLRTSIRFLVFCLIITAVSSGAAFAENVSEIRLALVPERNIFAQERKYSIMCDYMCDSLPVMISFEVTKSYKEVMVKIESGEAQGGFLGSFLALHGLERHGFIPIVRPVWKSGQSHYESFIFTGSGSEITSDVDTWRGKKIAMVSPHTSAGYFYPLALLRKNGINDIDGFFSEIIYAGSHDASIWMVAKGMADLGAAKNTVFIESVKRKPELEGEVQIIAKGGRYPDSTLMLRSDVPVEIRDAISKVMLTMNETDEGRKVLDRFGARRFIKTGTDQFEDVRSVIKGAGVDIEKINVADH